MTGLWRRELSLNKQNPTQMSGVIFGGPKRPYFELYYCRIIFSKISSKY